MSELTHAVLTNRAVLRAHGADVRELLQRLVTGNLDSVAAGDAVYSLLLTPQGKFLFDFFMVRDPADETAFLLDCAASRVAELQKRLTMYKLRADASFDDVSRDYVVRAIWGGAQDAEIPAGSVRFTDPRSPLLGVREIVPAAEVSVVVGDAQSYRDFAVSLGVPDGAVDILADKDFPIECNLDLLNGIDFKKGCFVGQEVASRAHRKGKARKRLVIGRIDGTPPAAGDDVMMGDAKVGSVAGVSGGMALAMVFLDRVAKAGGTQAMAGGATLALDVPPYAAFSLEGENA